MTQENPSAPMVVRMPSDGPYLCTDIEPGQLPEFVERAVCITDKAPLQDMLLLSTLTACSYALPHLKMLHGKPQHTYYPNLMTLIVAPAASGKGVMNNARLLVQPIADELEIMGRLAIIPANCSAAAFMAVLNQNRGEGFMMETEMDTLSHAWKSDYGDYSYLFRQVYEHETVSKARMGRGGGYIMVEEPRLSVLLSGTMGQLAPLVGNQENGLTSRFLPYIVEDIMPFDREAFLGGDHVAEDGARAVYKQLGGELLARWRWLSRQKHDCLWCLTEQQAEAMADFFDDGYRIAFEALHMPIGFDASFKRMAPTIKRLGMVLSALRLDMTQPLPEVLYCSDDDFRTLMLLAEKMLLHAGRMILMLPEKEPAVVAPATEVPTRAADHADALLAELPERFTTAEAYAAGEKLGMAERSVRDHLVQLVESKRLLRLKKGHYKKV